MQHFNSVTKNAIQWLCKNLCLSKTSIWLQHLQVTKIFKLATKFLSGYQKCGNLIRLPKMLFSDNVKTFFYQKLQFGYNIFKLPKSLN